MNLPDQTEICLRLVEHLVDIVQDVFGLDIGRHNRLADNDRNDDRCMCTFCER